MLKFYQKRKWVYVKDMVNYYCSQPVYRCKEGYRIKGLYRQGKERYHHSQKDWVIYFGRRRLTQSKYPTLEKAKLFCQLHHLSGGFRE